VTKAHLSSRDSKVLGASLVCLSAALWGLDGVVLTPRLSNLRVPFVVFLLHAVPFVLMQPFLWRRYAILRRMGRRGWLALLLVSLTGGLLGTLCIVRALFLVNFDQLSVVVLLQKLQPVFALSLAALLLRERVSLRFLGWASVAVAGAYLLTFGLSVPRFDLDEPTALAALLALAAAASFGSATVLGKQLLSTLDFRTATFGRYGMTSLLALLTLAITGVGLPFSTVTPTNWLLVLIIGVTTGSGAIFLYYFGLSRIRASVATICELCLPLSAVIFDFVVNDSVLGPAQWLGGLIMISAILHITGTERH